MSGWFGVSRGPKGDAGGDGPQGVPGSDGASATVAVGSVTTGAPGSSASVSNTGTSSSAVLNFAIPRGDKGDPGTPSKLVHSTTAMTNSAGAYTFTFPTEFSSPPRVAATVQSATADIFDVKITAVSTTSCSVQVGRTQASVVSLLGLTILSVPASVGAQTVHIIACQA